MPEATQRAQRDFSVLLPVYDGERPEYFRECLRSVMLSTCLPAQLVIVEDGPLTPELRRVIDVYRPLLPIHTVRCRKAGLPSALNAGLAECAFNIVARCDSDDINLPRRFELELQVLHDRPEVGVVGADIREFDPEGNAPMRARRLPTEGPSLRLFARTRNPLNHPSVMYRRDVIRSLGGYDNLRGFEDYALWVRCLVENIPIVNIPEPLVYVRAGVPLLARRRGLAYARAELAMASFAYRLGFLDLKGYLFFIAARVPLRLLPAPAIAGIYQGMLRRI